jgi:hypothetical protein
LTAVAAPLLSTPAVAYTGGPVLVTVLGWDPTERRIWLRESDAGETGGFGLFTFFDLASEDPTTRRRASWNRPDAPENDPDQNSKVAALRERLTPLWPFVATALPKQLTVSRIDSVSTPLGMRPRYRLRVLYEIGSDFECDAYSPEFIVKDVYPLPDRSAWLYVVAFRGNPFDGLLAETQVPTLFMAGAPRKVRVVTWEPRGMEDR